MSFLPTTETIVFPDGGWRNIPIRRVFTPGIHPETPSPWERGSPMWEFDKGGWQPPLDSEPGAWGDRGWQPRINDTFQVLRLPQTPLPGQRPNEIPLNPGSLNIPTFGGFEPGPLATALTGLGGALAGKFFPNLFKR